MSFRVEKVYLVPHRDLLVLAGRPDPVLPRAQSLINLPKEIQGPGWVPIHDVQEVAFADGAARTCVILLYSVVEPAPLMEFADLEGLSLSLRDA